MKDLNRMLYLLEAYALAVPYEPPKDVYESLGKAYVLFQGFTVQDFLDPFKVKLLTAENYVESIKEALNFLAPRIREAKDPMGMTLSFISKPYRMQFLYFARYLVSPQELSEYLAEVWTTSEFPNSEDLSRVLELFRLCDRGLLMNEEERETLNSLPDLITVYRGLQGKKAKVRGMSWTTDRAKAEWFETRFNVGNGTYQAKIDKKNVFAYFSGRGESEIVLNPRGLKEVQRLNQV